MSLFRRGGMWWYDFQIRGVRIRESSGCTSKSEAARVEALRKVDLMRSNQDLRVYEPEQKFWEFVFKEFAPWSENEHRDHPSTHLRYMRSAKVLVTYFGQRALSTITSAEVERFKIERSRERRKFAVDGKCVTPAAVNRDIAVLRILFNLAIRLNKARTNPVTGVKMLAENNLCIRVVSPAEEIAYLAAATQPLRDVATLKLETGMRPGEVFHLRKGDVDLGLGFVSIPGGKTIFARRTIPLTKRVISVLSHRTAEANTEWLFPSRNDPNRSLGWLRKAHVEALRLAGIEPPFRLYDLRQHADF